MMEQYGSFGGLYTCNHVEFGNLEKHYVLRFLMKIKILPIYMIKNTNLDVLCKHKIISSERSNYMRNKAQKFKCETVVGKYSKEATYITFKAAIGFQGNSIYWTVSLRYLDNNNENGIIFKFNRYIYLYIYPCQIFSKHGTQVPE